MQTTQIMFAQFIVSKYTFKINDRSTHLLIDFLKGDDELRAWSKVYT